LLVRDTLPGDLDIHVGHAFFSSQTTHDFGDAFAKQSSCPQIALRHFAGEASAGAAVISPANDAK
jgi:hypothetical protein